MNSYGFAIEDFFTNQERSREFLESIVEKAEEEIGYEIESGYGFHAAYAYAG